MRDLVTGPSSPFTPTERLVAFCIGDHMNADGAAWPSVRAISAWTGLHPRTVERALEHLVGTEGIFQQDLGGSPVGAHRASSTYRLRTTPGTTPEVGVATPGKVPVVTPGVLPVVRPRRPSATPSDPRHRATRLPAYDRTEGPIEGPNGKNQQPALAVPCAAPAFELAPAVEIVSPIREACEDWQRIFGGKAPGARIGKVLKPLAPKWPELRLVWCWYLETQQQYASPEQFAAKLGVWRAQADRRTALSAPGADVRGQRQRAGMVAAVVGGLKGDGTLSGGTSD